MLSCSSIWNLICNHFRRLFFSFLLRRSMQLYPRMLGGVRRLTSSVVVKEAPTEYLEREAESLQFILRNTTIPVPKVYDLQPASEPGQSHLVIQFMEGEMLARKWRVITSAQRRVVMRKLGEFVEQLRNLQQSSPSGWIGSVSGKGSYDARISTSTLFGPFENEKHTTIGVFPHFTYSGSSTNQQLVDCEKSDTRCPTIIEFTSLMVISRFITCW
jgi:hypothetical protein